MHIKVALVGALAATASAYTLQNEGTQQGITHANEYAIRNMDEICVSTKPVPMCQEEYVVKSYKNVKVPFHCTSRNSMEGQRWKEQIENDQVIPEMNGKSTHVQGRVQVPTKCVEKRQVNDQEQRRRKQQQQHGNRVELIEEGLQEFDQENQWNNEEDQLTAEEQYDQYRKNRFNEDNQWQKMQWGNQYPEMSQKKLHQLVQTDESKYQQFAEQLKELVEQKKVTSHLMPHVQTTLPTFFSQVVKQVYEAMQEEKQNKQHRSMGPQEQQEQHNLQKLVSGDYQQYRQLMKRVYLYIVKEALKLNQQAPQRFENIPELVRKVWEKVRRTELTRNQIERIEEVQQNVEQLLELDQTNQLIAEELVSEQLKASQKQARRNLMKVVITGLMMENSPSFQRNQNFEH